ncbi:MAG: hypothetical protein ABR968_04305 [Bacteroidales bacterium]|jgi:hypothetical protein
MKTTSKLLVFCMIAIPFMAFINAANLGKGINLISGSVKALKGEKVLGVKYDYSNLKVVDKPEAEWMKEEVAKKNGKKPGSGDKFKEAWYSDRASRFQPKFEELLNKYISDNGVSVSEKDTATAKYIIILETTCTDPGWNIGFTKRPSYIDAEVQIVESATKNAIAKLSIPKVPGSTYGSGDLDTGNRLAESYAKCGKELGTYLTKNAFGK